MKGSIQEKTNKSGKAYYYIRLSYKDPLSQAWRQKWIATGLTVKNNKRKAEAMMEAAIEENRYLELAPESVNQSIDPDILLCDYIDLWLEGKKRDLQISTYEGYEYRAAHIKRYFEPLKYKVRELSSRMVDQFLKHELAHGKRDQKTGEMGPLSVRSVRSYKSILSAVYDQAAIDGLVSSNPVTSVKVHGKSNASYQREEAFLTEDEVADVLKFLKEHYPRFLPMAFMAAYYGLRRSELLGLRWESINFQEKTISIENTVVRVSTLVEKEATKTRDSKRKLYLFPAAEECLSAVRQEQDDYKSFFGDAYRDTKGYVFTREDGSRYDPSWVSKNFEKAMKAYGRPDITYHKLRHSCASMLINRGWDIKQLQYWLGHADLETTLKIYSHYNKKRLNATENDLSEISRAAAGLF
nr:site-specific integrase [uncultured Acetatifactor sp.]